MYHLKGQAADRKPSAGVQEDGSLHPGVVENHANSGREIMAERANNARE